MLIITVEGFINGLQPVSVRSARLGPGLQKPGPFASLCSDKGLLPLAPYAVFCAVHKCSGDLFAQVAEQQENGRELSF